MFDADMIFRIPALLIALTIHEYAHAKSADMLGDPTPRYNGRLTLNPIAHLDPLGLIMLWLFKFGWAKPVPINAMNFQSWRNGTIIVSLAGPLSNIAIAFTVAFLMALIQKLGYKPDYVIWKTAALIYTYNLVFAIFNLIPIPPLDGSKVLTSLLPAKHMHTVDRLEQYGPVILIALVYFGIVGAITGPIEALFSQLMYAIIYIFL
jgi:Zn-dependent protease